MLWRITVALLWLVPICGGVVSAVMLWVLFGSPLEPRKSQPDTPAAQFEARKAAPVEGAGPLKVTGAAQPAATRETTPTSRAEAAAPSPTITFSDASPPAQTGNRGASMADRTQGGSGSSLPAAPDPNATARNIATQPATAADPNQLAATEPQARRPGPGQQDNPTALTEMRPAGQCRVDLCAAKYTSFRAADCTYQPYDGGPRRQCEISSRSPETAQQSAAAVTDQKPETKQPRTAEKLAEVAKATAPARVGGQCNVEACAAHYASFRAADCTYQPADGGSRRQCELTPRSADAALQAAGASDAKFEAKPARVAEKPEETTKSAASVRGGGQCNVDACAAHYASFHASDCTYQPHDGGPRRQCDLSGSSAQASSQMSRPAADAKSEAKRTQLDEDSEDIPKSGSSSPRGGGQCNVDACAASYASFRASDCTYQPREDGPRRQCER